jgi:hypothetical protein
VLNVRFLKGNSGDLPSKGNDDLSIYFVEDTQELFKSTGDGLPLAKYTDLLILDSELERTELVTPIPNKFYYVEENFCLWFFNGNSWNKITKDLPESFPANGGNADTLNGQDSSYYTNYNNLTNTPSIYDKVQIDTLMNNLQSKTYTHTQMVSSSEWNIIHNLNSYPTVTVVDSSGNVYVGDITYVSTNQIKINFSSAFSGMAYLN